MQTKSPLVRIACIAGAPLAILALFVSLQIQRRAHSSQSDCEQSYGSLDPACDGALRRTKAKF